MIFNGKIATPQSLLSRNPPSGENNGPRRSSSWAPREITADGGTTNVSTMIEETEFPEKSAAGKAKRFVDFCIYFLLFFVFIFFSIFLV